MPRLLVLTPDFPPSPGGIQRLLDRLLAHLPYDPTVVVARAAQSQGSPPTSRATVVYTGNSHGARSLAAVNVRGLREGLRQRPDVVLSGHVFTAPASVLIG